MHLLQANSRFFSCRCLRQASNSPTNSFKKFTGRYKWWTDPVYVQPVVNPLHRGPDFSFSDGRSPKVTHQYEFVRRQEHTELAKQIVQYLGEIKEAETLHAEKKAIEEQESNLQAKYSLSSKGTSDFS